MKGTASIKLWNHENNVINARGRLWNRGRFGKDRNEDNPEGCPSEGKLLQQLSQGRAPGRQPFRSLMRDLWQEITASEEGSGCSFPLPMNITRSISSVCAHAPPHTHTCMLTCTCRTHVSSCHLSGYFNISLIEDPSQQFTCLPFLSEYPRKRGRESLISEASVNDQQGMTKPGCKSEAPTCLMNQSYPKNRLCRWDPPSVSYDSLTAFPRLPKKGKIQSCEGRKEEFK